MHSHPAPPLQGQVAQMSAVWSLFDERATGDAAKRNTTADVMMEMKCYLEELLIQLGEGPRNWWQAEATVFPYLLKVMEGRLCIVATSVPSETLLKNRAETKEKPHQPIQAEGFDFSECQPALRTNCLAAQFYFCFCSVNLFTVFCFCVKLKLTVDGCSTYFLH